MKGIDISKYQTCFTKAEFKSLKKMGYEFAIIKIGGNNDGWYQDRAFQSHYTNAKAAGLKVGAYYYYISENGTPVENVAHILTLLQGIELDFPFFLDVEEKHGDSKSLRTNRIRQILNVLEELNWFVGIYGGEANTFSELVEKEKLVQYTWWVANWSKKPAIPNYGIWQKGYVRIGDFGNIDINESKTDYSTIIRKGGFNGN